MMTKIHEVPVTIRTIAASEEEAQEKVRQFLTLAQHLMEGAGQPHRLQILLGEENLTI
jgi:hypothetical protein